MSEGLVEGKVSVYLEYKCHTEIIAVLTDETLYDSLIEGFKSYAKKHGAILTEIIH
jgi:hypothetical protein